MKPRVQAGTIAKLHQDRRRHASPSCGLAVLVPLRVEFGDGGFRFRV